MGDRSTMPPIVGIGTSAGGCAALRVLAPQLNDMRQAAYIVVQHTLDGEPSYLRDMLAATSTTMEISEAMDKTPVAPGHVYTAPSGYHLYIEQNGRLSLSVDDPVCYSRPSIDVFFDSLAFAAREKAIGILLTGANQDGALGLYHIKQMGGMTIVQDPHKAEFPAMPQAAIDLFQPDLVCALPEISMNLKTMLERLL